MDLTSFARVLGGAKRLEGSGANRPTNVSRMTGTAVADSADGKVLVRLDAQVFSGDGSQYVELPTSVNVREGDLVYVDAVGADGKGKSLTVSGAFGGGDRQQEEIGTATSSASAARTTANAANSTANAASATANSAASTANSAATAAAAAQTAANAAVTTANATAQHFWSDNNGVHVSSAANDGDGVRNMLLNSLGMLFRSGTNNLLSLVTGDSPGVHIYDGAGNAAANIVASFTSTLIELGKNSTNSVIRLCGGAGKITATSTDIYMSGANRLAWIGLWERATASHVTIGAAKSGKTASINLNANESGKTADVVADTFKATLTGCEGFLRPIGIYSESITTAGNSYSNTTITFGSAITMSDTNYSVILSTEGSPAGFTKVAYTVTNKTSTGFTIHCFNDYTASVTQTVNAMVVHR